MKTDRAFAGHGMIRRDPQSAYWSFLDAIRNAFSDGELAGIRDPSAMRRLEAKKDQSRGIDVTPEGAYWKEAAYRIDGAWYVREQGMQRDEPIHWWKIEAELPSPYGRKMEEPPMRIDLEGILRRGRQQHWRTGADAIWAPIGAHFRSGSDFVGKITGRDTDKMIYAAMADRRTDPDERSNLLLAAGYGTYYASKSDHRRIAQLALRGLETPKAFSRLAASAKVQFLRDVGEEELGADFGFVGVSKEPKSAKALGADRSIGAAAPQLARLIEAAEVRLRASAKIDSGKPELHVRSVMRHGQIYGHLVAATWGAKRGSVSASWVVDHQGRILERRAPKFQPTRHFCGTD